MATMAMAPLFGTGCLVTDNPEVQAPPLRGPFLTSFFPATFRIVPVEHPPGVLNRDPTTISFQISSDDGGDPPQVFIQRDFEVSPPEDTASRKAKNILIRRIEPGDFDHPRPFSATFTLGPDVSSGCHSVTAIVAYDFDIENEWLPAAGSRWESATWWLDVDDTGASGANIISTCPGIGGAVDAGREGGSSAGSDGSANGAFANLEGGR